jgi:hypothetical protein
LVTTTAGVSTTAGPTGIGRGRRAGHGTGRSAGCLII